MFANIYLNELDQYVKHILKCKYYYRYMDDIVILFKTKKDAKEALDKIKKFLKEHLELELNDKTNIFRGKQGVNFCGYKINENRLKIRDKGKRKLKKKVKKLKQQIKEEKINSVQTAPGQWPGAVFIYFACLFYPYMVYFSCISVKRKILEKERTT